MKQQLLMIGVILCLLTALFAKTDYDYSDNIVIVLLTPEASNPTETLPASFFGGVELKLVENISLIHNEKALEAIKARGSQYKAIYKLTLTTNDKAKVWEAIEQIKKIDGIRSANPNYIYTADIFPDDPSLNVVWGLQGGYGLHAPQAWDINTGSHNVIVGVIDTGIASHPDLNANVTTGWDFYNNNAITTDDNHGHGTHVSGTIGAVGDNGLGIVGVNWNVTIFPMQSSYRENGNEWFSSDTVVSAITYAANTWGTADQISIISYSVSGFGRNTDVRDAVDNYPGLYVWGAANDNQDVDDYIEYYESGNFDLPNLIGVGAIEASGERSYFSNYSSSGVNVQIYAPGTAIYSTITGYNYASWSGTSMATPHVSGVAALLLADNPSLTASQLKDLIISESDPHTIATPKGVQEVSLLNVYRAISGEAYWPPRNVSAQIADNCINLSWIAPWNATPLGYNVYRDLEVLPLNPELITSLSTSDYSVEIDNVYKYTVRAVYPNDESFASQPVWVVYAAPPITMHESTFQDYTTDGWVIVNSNQPNKWIIGNATGSASSRSIYISNNNNANTYSLTGSSAVHFFRDILFTSPTGNTLSFDFKGVGEYNDYFWEGIDYLGVYLCDTSYIPLGSTIPEGTLLGEYVASYGWYRLDIELPDQPVNTVKRLVFSWINDSSDGSQPPAAVDNIIINAGSPMPIFSINPTSYDFGEVIEGATSPTQTFTIANIGSGAMTVTAIDIVGAEFSLTATGLPWGLEAGATRSFTLAFMPTTTGEKTANVSITHNTSGSPCIVEVSGVGAPVSEYDETAKPIATALGGNYPNPFNPETMIGFTLARAEVVVVDIYNLRGQKVRSLAGEVYDVGSHSVVWNGLADDGSHVGSGVYFYRMTAGEYVGVGKMVMVK